MHETNNPEELVKMLDDEHIDDELFRFEIASYQLWKLGERAVPALVPILYDASEKVCVRAAYLLGNIGTDQALAALRTALEDKTSSLAKTSIQQQLWKSYNDDSKAIDFSITLYKRSIDWRIRDDVDDGEVDRLVEAMNKSEFPRDEVYALAKIGDQRVIEPLIQALRSENDKIFHYAFYGLLKIGEAAVEPLIERLNDTNPSFRRLVAWLLGALGDTRAVQPLIHNLNDEEGLVQVTTIHALGNLRDERAIEFLMPFLMDKDEWIRQATIMSLGQIGEQRTIETIVSALDDDSLVVQLGAAQVLAEFGDQRALNTLNALLSTQWRQAAQNALRRLAGEANTVSIFQNEWEDH